MVAVKGCISAAMAMPYEISPHTVSVLPSARRIATTASVRSSTRVLVLDHRHAGTRVSKSSSISAAERLCGISSRQHARKHDLPLWFRQEVPQVYSNRERECSKDKTGAKVQCDKHGRYRKAGESLATDRSQTPFKLT